MEIKLLPAVAKFLVRNEHLTPILEFPAKPGNQNILVRDTIQDEWGKPIHYVLVCDHFMIYIQNTNEFFGRLEIPDAVIPSGVK